MIFTVDLNVERFPGWQSEDRLPAFQRFNLRLKYVFGPVDHFETLFEAKLRQSNSFQLSFLPRIPAKRHPPSVVAFGRGISGFQRPTDRPTVGHIPRRKRPWTVFSVPVRVRQ
jgi:hypothetical protein